MAGAMTTDRVRRVGALCGVVLLSAALAGRAADKAPAADEARRIVAAAGFRGGLIVHLGCGDGRLTAALHTGERCLVHGLDTDADNVRRARQHIRKLGLGGRVSVERFDGQRLPYAENLVNLLVAEEIGGVGQAEAMRVLAPGGVLYARQSGRWRKAVKPRPANTDEWTHYLHDASGNPVANDNAVGPPRRLRWVAEPRHMRGHEHLPGINALVSTGGRIFYLADEASTASVRRPARWRLVARDAYNGLLLWKRPVGTWHPHIVNWGTTPRQLQRRLVAVGNRVYVTLGLHAPLSALDAATGKTIRTYDETRGAEEVVCHEGVLLLAVRAVTNQRVSELAEWQKLLKADNSPLYDRDSAEPLVLRLRKTENKAPRTIVAVEADTGRVLWRKAGPEAAGLRTQTLSAVGQSVYYQKGGEIVCVDLKTGRQRWAVRRGPLRVIGGGCIVCAGGTNVTALSAETGKVLWSEPGTLCQVRDVFVIGDSVWLGGFKPWQGRKSGKRGPVWGPYFATQRDLATGKILKRIEPECPGHHHRCWQNKATGRYILGGRRGVEFIDLASGQVLWHSWVRGVCRYGVMPCNGLLYAPPHACGCYVAAKLTGFYALATDDPAKAAPTGNVRRPVERGEAFADAAAGRNPPGSARGFAGAGQSAIRNPQLADWPTYRHDAERSGSTPRAVPAALGVLWQADVGGRPTAPTVAAGKVLLASVDDHRVCAFDAASGAAAWQFTAGSRVDSPPTLHAGRAIFGCRDGHVYSLRASDGAPAWRLRAARTERRIVARGQIESPSPVPGSVLVAGGVAYLTAGRSSYLDGGIDLCRVECATGKLLSATPIYSPDPETGRQPKHFGPAHMAGALGEILSADGQCVYLREMVFDRAGAAKAQGSAHLFALTGFRDATWPHRSYWMFGKRISLATGCSGRDRKALFGRVLVFDDATVYGYGRANVHWSNQLQDKAYRLFARGRDELTNRWARAPGVQVRAMVLAGKVLFVAGPEAKAGGVWAGDAADRPALLVAVSASDGAELARYPLAAPPVFDGMAAAGGRLYIALASGRLVCLGGKTAG